ncbi:hypothetical protein GQ457_13G011850 [Hibiscus cannabinus]
MSGQQVNNRSGSKQVEFKNRSGSKQVGYGCYRNRSDSVSGQHQSVTDQKTLVSSIVKLDQVFRIWVSELKSANINLREDFKFAFQVPLESRFSMQANATLCLIIDQFWHEKESIGSHNHVSCGFMNNKIWQKTYKSQRNIYGHPEMEMICRTLVDSSTLCLIDIDVPSYNDTFQMLNMTMGNYLVIRCGPRIRQLALPHFTPCSNVTISNS